MRLRSFAAIAGAITLLGCNERPRDPRPNVLLISLDSVRRDMLGCYGSTFVPSPSPNLDQLARDGIRIEDALSSTSWTLPAHATLFTGVPEIVHGVEQDGQRLDESLPTLAEELAEAGYYTAGVYSGPYLDPRFGLGRGFAHWQPAYGPELAGAARAAAEALARVHALDDTAPLARRQEALAANADAERDLEIASHRDSSARNVTDVLLDELDEAAGDPRPFFLFAHYFDPHYDYVPPPPHAREFDPDYTGTVDGRDFVRHLSDPTVEPRDVRHLRALHAGELAWTDAQLGRVLEDLERRGLTANTLVIVTADHGDEFHEHGAFGHRRTLYQEVVRVPLILRWPAGLPTGTLHRGTRSLASVKPTVLALVEGERWRAPLLASSPEFVLGRLILSPTGAREDVRVIESFRHLKIKLLRERSLGAPAAETLRWIDLQAHPEERAEDWSEDFGGKLASAALDAFRREYAWNLRDRRAAPRAEKTEDLLALFRGLGYVGEEARVGALSDDDLVLAPPEGPPAAVPANAGGR